MNVPSTPGNNLPYGIRYYVAVCDVPGVTPGYWPARYMSDKLGSKEFDEEDFYVSNPTHLGFSIQPTTNKLGRTMYTVQVALLDTWNNVVADDNTKVTVSINSGAGRRPLGDAPANDEQRLRDLQRPEDQRVRDGGALQPQGRRFDRGRLATPIHARPSATFTMTN